MRTLIIDDPYQEIPEARARDVIRFWFNMNFKQKGGGGETMPRSMIITPVLNGFIVKVGCQEVVFTNLGHMVDEIHLYYKDPKSTEESYLRNAINHPSTNPAPEVDVGAAKTPR